MAVPRVLLEETWATMPAWQINDGDLAVCLHSTSTPTVKTWLNGIWYLALPEGVALTITVATDPRVDDLVAALDGLSVRTSEAAGIRTIWLEYDDGIYGTKVLLTHNQAV